MRHPICTSLILFPILLLLSPVFAATSENGFVLIKGGKFNMGNGERRSSIILEDYEICDHPITNAEYKVFTDETGHAAPLHWKNGRIPKGKDNYPVIFVNRPDADDYLKWRTKKENRVYRFPTSVEFEWAARGGLQGKKYPWGDESPANRANYDADGKRRFDHWQDYLQPAKSGQPNGYGLYGMAGNVMQFVSDVPDLGNSDRYRYRIENFAGLEKHLAGGSWAKSVRYLRCGASGEMSAGVRQPDLGFRLVRSPKRVDWHEENRKLCALSQGNGKISLTWALLASDSKSTAFHVYRSATRACSGERLTSSPITNSTTFMDRNVPDEDRLQYYVRAIDANGKPGRRSEWIGISPSSSASRVVTTFEPFYRYTKVSKYKDLDSEPLAPEVQHERNAFAPLVPVFGDLNGDGRLDCVIRLANGNEEGTQDPGEPVQLEAFNSYGHSLWRKNICRYDHCFGNQNNVPYCLWDMDGDGKAEVIVRIQLGDDVYLAILNGMSGEIIAKTPWTPIATDFQRTSTRMEISIACLDGKNPAIISQSGLYETEILTAYDARLNKLWQFDSFAETNGSGAHRIEVADVDGDGKQEVFDGTTCLNPDGTLRWSIYKQHADLVSIRDFLPDRPGLEVFYMIESSMTAGVYMVDARNGKILWKVNRDDDPRWVHAHTGWTADIWDGSPGLECVSNRAGHSDNDLVLFSSSGKVLLEHFPFGLSPVEWSGADTRDLLSKSGRAIGRFNGKTVTPLSLPAPNPIKNSALIMTADLYGDFRDELVLRTIAPSGLTAITVVSATDPIEKRYISRTENLEYRLWLARNMGGGYATRFEIPLQQPEK